MKLYQDMAARILEEECTAYVAQLKEALPRMVERRCYLVLSRIQQILADNELNDPECFQKIEEMITALEDVGSDGGNRHDFG